MPIPITDPAHVPGPLAGVRVLDLTTVIMGPYATQILGDLGADVIKVEDHDGDMLRHLPPARHPGMSGFVLNLHRNKRSVQLDLKSAEGKRAFLAIAATVDAVVTNIRPQAVVRLGLDYDEVRAVNPRIVYCNAHGYRADGPYGSRPAYDDLIQAASGLAGMVGRVRGEPQYVPTVVADKVSGLTIAYAVLGALFHQQRTGQGQHVEVSMLEAMLSFMLVEHQQGHTFVPPIGRTGYPRLMTMARRPLRASDGWIALLPYTDQNWRDFFTIVGRPDMISDERFATLSTRLVHVEVVYGFLEGVALTRTVAEWLEVCDAHSIPAAPVLDLDRAADDVHVAATGFFGIAMHPSEGAYRTIASPVQFSETPASIHRHAPRHGEHTDEVLREVGYLAR